MSDLDLKEFHSFLEDLIETSSQGGRFSVDATIQTLIAKHPTRLEKVQAHINDLGLRALIRNNCRAKNSAGSSGPDMFGHYRVGKRVAVPFYDDLGKLRWDRKPRRALTFGDIDGMIARWNERPTRPSRERRDLDEIVRRTRPYRNQASNVAKALEMADRDGR